MRSVGCRLVDPRHSDAGVAKCRYTVRPMASMQATHWPSWKVSRRQRAVRPLQGRHGVNHDPVACGAAVGMLQCCQLIKGNSAGRKASSCHGRARTV